MLKAKYKGYLATQRKDNTVLIYNKNDVLEATVSMDKKLDIKGLRTVINKHIKAGGKDGTNGNLK